MENQTENEMETGVMYGVYKDPRLLLIPTLGPKVYEDYLHWAIWILRLRIQDLGLSV